MSSTQGLPTAEVLKVIAEVLAPYLGQTMARASASAHCGSLQIDGETVDPQKVSALLDRIGKGLVIFLGAERSRAVISEIATAISRLNGAAA